MIDVVNMFPLLKEGTLPYEVANSIISPFTWEDFVFFPSSEFGYKANQASMNSKGLSNMKMMFSTVLLLMLQFLIGLLNKLQKSIHIIIKARISGLCCFLI